MTFFTPVINYLAIDPSKFASENDVTQVSEL